ncbi:hypothetical protein [Gordonia rhizosphera]|uniref:Uncharacterized protein n=1 Tax=Gordonia rhizosphera NBRC 16068 TaxID=1108045 RepID=K6VSK2_9ACTN|nr:hypothetical protein [Gordonia rhizosphera]GAB89860.1 hypothetical protein GORHZ_073_00030 [Gordonia rhizosphera NBRC 16068]
MTTDSFVALSEYLDPALLSFVSLPAESLERIGVVGTKVTVDEQVNDGKEQTETFYDEFEGADVTVTWTEADVSRKGSVELSLSASDEISFKLPGVDGMEFVIASAGSNSKGALTVTLTVDDDGVSLEAALACSLRLDSSLIKPMQRTGQGGADAFKPDTTGSKVEVQIPKLRASLDSQGMTTFGIDGSIAFDQPVMIGDTGVVLDDIKSLAFNFDGSGKKPASAPAGWKGLYLGTAKVYIPAVLSGSIGASDLGIGSGGVYGAIGYSGSALAGEVLGMKGTVSSVAIEFVQSVPVKASIGGKLTLPFFDAAVAVTVGLGYDGSFSVKFGNGSGLHKLVKKDVLEFTLDSLAFAVDNGGVFAAKMSGKLTPLFGKDAGLDWPTIDVKELSIDSDGNVRLEGGWLNLKEQYSLDFYGFTLEISKLGFGKTEDGGKWLGFSGGLKLVEGLPAGASVEGLRVIWYDTGSPRITLNGVGVEFAVPGALQFNGFASYRELTVGSQTVRRFDGDIKLQLTALNMTIDGKLVVGTASEGGSSYTFFAIYVGAELPAGIPLWSTGLGLYGLAGLFAIQMEPDKKSDEEWFEGWYKRSTPGVTDLKNKWKNEEDSLALGAGITLGTVADNGYAFNGKFLFVIVFPGPILLIEGKANLLQERAKLEDDPNFRALFVLDAQAGSILIGIDAQYLYGSGGELLDIRGSAKAFFDFSDASKFYLHLGEKTPREKRIRAQILSLWYADSYFMLDYYSIGFGGRVGYDARWSFGPLRVTLEAWIENNALISWKPVHLHGDLWLHGKAELSVFGFGIGLSADAEIAADVFDPFHLLARLSVGINLPWPLPDFDVDLTLEWEGDEDPPPLPVPVKEVAIEHFKSTASWPLKRAGKQPLLLPNYDADGDGFRDEPGPSKKAVATQDAKPPPAGSPVVPMDSRPHITFGRKVQDDPKVGGNQQPQKPEYEVVGRPQQGTTAGAGPVEVRFSLYEITLDRWRSSSETWQTVARSASPAHPIKTKNTPILWGSWAPVPQMPDGAGKNPGQTKLWLWSKNPFDYTRSTGREWDEWFTDRFDNYPCIPQPPTTRVCYDFEKLPPGAALTVPWAHPDQSGLILTWTGPASQTVTSPSPPIGHYRRALCFPGQQPVTIDLPGLYQEVEIVARDQEGLTVRAWTSDGAILSPTTGGKATQLRTVVKGDRIAKVEITGNYHLCLAAICLVTKETDADAVERELMTKHMVDELARWEQTGFVLDPDTQYRLKIVTQIKAVGRDKYAGTFDANHEHTEFAYFQTQGPPGLTTLSVPRDHPKPQEFDSGLDTLSRYVAQTIPATVVGAGQKPVLPRPVFRAYDVGVDFNEDYVDLMYRLDGRDLGLYLYDNNNQQARDAEGGLIVPVNHWGDGETLTLEAKDEFWVTTVNASTCLTLDANEFPKTKTMALAERSQVLEADKVHEARLVPLLFHDDFSQGLSAWQVVEEGTVNVPSAWSTGSTKISGASAPSWYVQQTSNIWGGTLDGSDPVKPGTMLIHAGPGWTDYRFTVSMRSGSGDDDAIGIVFRYQDTKNFYRFSMDRQRKYRRLVRVVKGVHTILAEDTFVYITDTDYPVTVEAIGSSIRIHQSRSLVFDVTDSALRNGGVGLYCWGNTDARFTDARVDDYRPTAPIVYRFKFITSQYANFFHAMHSYRDEIWVIDLDAASGGAVADTDLADVMAVAQTPAAAPTEAEQRGFATLAAKLLSGRETTMPVNLEVSRLQRGSPQTSLALLVRASEPIDWSRTVLRVLRAESTTPPPTGSCCRGVPKLTDASVGAATPNDEHVTVLVQDRGSLANHRLAYRSMPGPLAIDSGDPVLFTDDFTGVGGLLYRETFDANTISRYTIVDQGNRAAPSKWEISGGHIVQTANIHAVEGPEYRGTMALVGDRLWDDIRLQVRLRSDDDDAIGVVFRYQDSDNYYRFSMDRERSYRRMVKCADGTTTILWEDNVAYVSGFSYDLIIEAHADRILGWLNHILLLDVEDGALRWGRVGLYAWACEGAHFEALSVEALEAPVVLWQPPLTDLSDLAIEQETGLVQGPANWTAQGGTLSQASYAHVPDPSPNKPGTYALGGSATWTDVRIATRFRFDDEGAIGFMVRYQDGDNYYRFSTDRTLRYRRLIKKVGGVVSVLWQDSDFYERARHYDLTITAVGPELSVYVDGSPVCRVFDSSLSRGRVAAYCWGNPSANFDRLLVTDLTRRVGRWTISDQGTESGPSVWQLRKGELLQSSDIWGGSLTAAALPKPGTWAIVGDETWDDVRLAVRLCSDQDDAVGLLFRYIDADNYYRLSLDADRKIRRLVKCVDGVVSKLWERKDGYPVGRPVTLTVDAVGSRLVSYLNGQRLFDVTDDDHQRGKIGLYCWKNGGVRFDRIEVLRPPIDAYALFSDSFDAGSAKGFAFVSDGTAMGPAQWQVGNGVLRQTSSLYSPPNDHTTLSKQGTHAVAGDPTWGDVVYSSRLRSGTDYAIGLMFRYSDQDNYYRFSMDRGRRYRRLVKNVGGKFHKLWDDDHEIDLDRVYEVTIIAVGKTLRGYLDGVPMFVVEDDAHAAGRIGLYCWANTDARFSTVRVYPASKARTAWRLDEPFDHAIPGRWTFVEDGKKQGPANWRIGRGELRQTSNIYGGKIQPKPIDKPGTYAVAGQSSWSDYRFSTRLRSGDDDAIGVMFRYQDGDNYYRFSMDRERSYRRLVKKVNGLFTLLWEEATRYELDRDYLLTVDCQGSRLRGYLDGVGLFDVCDDDLSMGKIALYCWGNMKAIFTEVRVADPEWSPYHVFGAEPRLPAGTRVRVYAGSPTTAPLPEAGMEQRFVAGAGGTGTTRFLSSGVELRLVSPRGTVLHQRWFLADADYSPVAAKVVRQRDGSSFLLVIPTAVTAGTAVKRGAFRLELTYKRDNQSNDPPSVVLRQAGSTADEVATLDVPWESAMDRQGRP